MNRLKKVWAHWKENENYMEMLRYPVAGFSGFGADYLLFLLLLWLWGEEWYLLWKGIAFLAGLGVNYLLCVKFVFWIVSAGKRGSFTAKLAAASFGGGTAANSGGLGQSSGFHFGVCL